MISKAFDYGWQRFFAACSLIFAVLTGAGLEGFWPQPPHFGWTAQQTAHYYVVHETRFRIGITLITIGMAFLLMWTVQFCLMLSRLEGGSRAVSAVTFASLISTPILLAFDLGVFAIAAFRPESTSPDVTRALSDVAWTSSELIWPMLAAGMALGGILIIKTQGRPGSLPRWIGYFGLVDAVIELAQIPIVFEKHGPFAANAIAWYAPVVSWGLWALSMGWAMWNALGREYHADAAAP
jgi:hypothetical protein